MLVSLTVGKVDAGVTVLLTPDKRLIEFPSILLPPNITSGGIVDITVARNHSKEITEEREFRLLQERIYQSFGALGPAHPVLRCRNATQTSVVLEWDPVQLATADLISLSLYRNGQKAGNISRPLQMHSTKISGLAVDTEYTFHLVLRTSAGTHSSEKLVVRTHKMTDLSGITITTGLLPNASKEKLAQAVERIGAKIVDSVRIDTTHFVTIDGRGPAWEKAVENNIPVVRPEWVDACEKSGRILGVTKFYLDAMRAGPPSEEQVAPQVPAKKEPRQVFPEEGHPQSEATVAESTDMNGTAVTAEEVGGTPSSEQSSDSYASQSAEVEANSAQRKSPKTDIEGPEEQSLATRPKVKGEEEEEGFTAKQVGATKLKPDESDKNDLGSEEGEDKSEERNGRSSSTADRASFQEVEL